MAKPPADVNYTFDEAQIARLRAYGDVRRHEAGDVLITEGERRVDCLVTLSGYTEIFVAMVDGQKRLGWMEAGQITGDMSALTGQSFLANVTMGEAGEVLHIPYERFQKLLIDDSQLSDVFVRTFTARRVFGRESRIGSVIVIAQPFDREAYAARDLLAKHAVPHLWLDPDKDELATRIMAAKELTDADLPVVIRGRSRVMRKPTVVELSEAFGFDLLPDGATADVIVVGSGPGGLAAAVYAGSEGLSVLALDGSGPGGQAGTSSKIENYLGFPAGVSGQELADRAAVQAQKFGVRLAAPAKADRLEMGEDGAYRLVLEDGRTLNSRAIVVSTGARYRRLPIARRAEFEGRGIYYGASPMEAQLCAGSATAVVGAGNSAGQGAMYLAQTAKEVHVLFRRPDIRETMSEYLVRRLEEAPNVHLHPQAEISALHGNDCADNDRLRLTHLTITENGVENRLDAGFVFLFLGAQPCSDWLPEGVRTDEKGFVKTGSALGHLDLGRAQWPLERLPAQYETSWPRVYAVGDVRSGSVKRVASAVGEGSVVVSDIHKALAALDDADEG